MFKRYGNGRNGVKGFLNVFRNDTVSLFVGFRFVRRPDL